MTQLYAIYENSTSTSEEKLYHTNINLKICVLKNKENYQEKKRDITQ
jgi:hypothetical protein